MILNPIIYPTSINRFATYRIALVQFENLLQEVHKMELPPEVIVSLNSELEMLHSFSGGEKQFFKKLKNTKTVLLKILYKEVSVVPKNHYRNLWIAIGLFAIGIPMGIFLSHFLDNSIYMGLGISIGSAIGLIIGSNLDKQAEVEGRQIAIRI